MKPATKITCQLCKQLYYEYDEWIADKQCGMCPDCEKKLDLKTHLLKGDY